MYGVVKYDRGLIAAISATSNPPSTPGTCEAALGTLFNIGVKKSLVVAGILTY